MKKVFILWSGGLDSTYLVFDNLRKGNNVTAGYIEIENNKSVVFKERTSICKLYDIFYENYPETFCYKELSKVLIEASGISYLHFKQIPIWLMSSLYVCGEFDEIQIAYVMNDDAIAYLEDLKKIHRANRSIAPDIPPITFPLAKTKKESIIETLPEFYLKQISFCEGVDSDIPFCGECPSCNRMKNTLENMGDKYKNLFAFGVSTEPIQYELDLGVKRDTIKLNNI